MCTTVYKNELLGLRIYFHITLRCTQGGSIAPPTPNVHDRSVEKAMYPYTRSIKCTGRCLATRLKYGVLISPDGFLFYSRDCPKQNTTPIPCSTNRWLPAGLLSLSSGIKSIIGPRQRQKWVLTLAEVWCRLAVRCLSWHPVMGRPLWVVRLRCIFSRLAGPCRDADRQHRLVPRQLPQRQGAGRRQADGQEECAGGQGDAGHVPAAEVPGAH